jgi:hypothetical protein
MAIPSFTAEQSIYRSNRHYRSSALASVVGGVRPSDGLPGGSYQQSCFNCSYDGNTLVCSCLDESGGSRQATLPGVPNCIGDIGNNNGHLNCFTGDCCNFVTVLSASSRRYKENIRDLSEEAAAALLQLRPVTFRYRQPATDGTNQPPRYGLIAEEVAELLPQVVARNAGGQVEGIDYFQFPALLLSAFNASTR